MQTQDYIAEIERLKKEKNAVILAHYYQVPEIQDIGDYVGDSLALAKAAAKTDSDVIVFAGVHFMAETAKILNPHKKVLLPDLAAGCSLADSCPPADFKRFVEERPDHKVVTYINCTADIKALSDVIVTSSNAKRIIDSFPTDQKLIFAPDRNLGAYLNKVTGRDMVLWDGSCMVHEAFSLEKVSNLLMEHPKAKLIAHPESEEQILNVASFVGSTSALLTFVQQDESEQYIVATENGIFHQMKKEAPHKEFIEAPMKDDSSCACSECFHMKLNTLEKLYLCLRDETPEIEMDAKLLSASLPPIQAMLNLS